MTRILIERTADGWEVIAIEGGTERPLDSARSKAAAIRTGEMIAMARKAGLFVEQAA